MSIYYPGKVNNLSLALARTHNSQRVDNWLGAGGDRGGHFPQPDVDLTNNYHESLSNHLLHSMTGIHTNLVLWGDSRWYTDLSNDEVFHILHRVVITMRGGVHGQGLEQHRVQVMKLVFQSQIFDCAHGRLHDVAYREIISNETSGLRNCLPAADQRSLLIVTLHAQLGGEAAHEVSMKIIVPPPYDSCTWDVHQYLRSSDESLVGTNALSTLVFHAGATDPPNAEVAASCARLKQRVNAPVPNTQAAVHLFHHMKRLQDAPAAAPGQAEWQTERVNELLEELGALEGELVSVRAAYVASNQRATALEAHVNREANIAGGGKPLLLEPAAVQREQLRVSEEVLRRINVDYVDLNRRLMAIELAQDVTADQKLLAMLYWRQQENELLMQRVSEAHLHVVGSGSGYMPGAAGMPQSVHPPPPQLNRQTELAMQQPNTAPFNGASGGAGQPNAEMNRIGDSLVRHVALGANVDPVLLLYQAKLVELETEVVRMADVDTKGSIDQFYIEELATIEKELVQWMTRCHVAEGQLKVFQQALKAKDERSGLVGGGAVASAGGGGKPVDPSLVSAPPFSPSPAPSTYNPQSKQTSQQASQQVSPTPSHRPSYQPTPIQQQGSLQGSAQGSAQGGGGLPQGSFRSGGSNNAGKKSNTPGGSRGSVEIL